MISEEYNKIIEEIWKPIINYENLYEISNYGRIKRIANGSNSTFIGKILKPQKISKYGHLGIRLYKDNNNKLFPIHRLVLETFIGPSPIGMQCRHLDGNPQNNKLDNLKWGTCKENSEDRIAHGKSGKGSNGSMSKLTEQNIPEIKLLYRQGISQINISRVYNVSKYIIWAIIHNKIWKHIK